MQKDAKALESIDRYLVVGGVPLTRTLLQIGGAVLAILFLHELFSGRSQTYKIVGCILLGLVGNYIGKLLWDTIGSDLESFTNDLFPWFDYFDSTTPEEELFGDLLPEPGI